MKWIVSALLAFLLWAPTQAAMAGWDGTPYLEYRHSLLSIEPSRIGASDCPCYGWELEVGADFTPFGINRWQMNVAASVVGQTRWDDPEVYRYRVESRLRLFQHFSITAGYREIHNLDRPTPKATRIVDWNHFYSRHPGQIWWGKSGPATLWVGFRVDLR